MTVNITFIAGIDEAGRGPVLGPLVFGAVILSREQERELAEKGITDSKLLNQKRRSLLYQEITKLSVEWHTLHLSAKEIDTRRNNGETLNQIEVKSMIKLLKQFTHPFNILYIDAADVKADRYAIPFRESFPGVKIVSRHKADLEFVVVGGASILAKVERDIAIEELEKKTGMKLGSGYPSDPHTRKFLKTYYQKHHSLPDFVRKTWKTVNNVIEEVKGLGTLDKYLQ